jgi:hypothetical protein
MLDREIYRLPLLPIAEAEKTAAAEKANAAIRG